MLKNLLQLARPHQYTKNLFVFLPAFFSFQLNDVFVWVYGFQAFVAFSLMASSVYTLNDWIDREEDQKHPEKKHRPIASGKIGKQSAFLFMGLLFTVSLLCGYAISVDVVLLLGGYFIMNIAYSIKLKHIALIDVSIIAVGFVIRLLVGAVATTVILSHWIIVITFLLAMFLGLAKRRDDVLIYLNTRQKTRKAVNGYSLRFLDTFMAIISSVVIIAYILWSISPFVAERLGSSNIYITSLFVLLGISRYLQITFVEENSGSPSKILLHDRFIQLSLAGWIITFVIILYV